MEQNAMAKHNPYYKRRAIGNIATFNNSYSMSFFVKISAVQSYNCPDNCYVKVARAEAKQSPQSLLV